MTLLAIIAVPIIAAKLAAVGYFVWKHGILKEEDEMYEKFKLGEPEINNRHQRRLVDNWKE